MKFKQQALAQLFDFRFNSVRSPYILSHIYMDNVILVKVSSIIVSF